MRLKTPEMLEHGKKSARHRREADNILEIAERMCDRIGIINNGRLIAVGTMEELRAAGEGESSLEDIFLNLTGGAEYAEIAEVLK